MKNSSTLAVSLPINYLIKFGFVSVNGHRENYFVDALCRFCLDFDLFKPDENSQMVTHDFLSDVCDFIRQNFILRGI